MSGSDRQHVEVRLPHAAIDIPIYRIRGRRNTLISVYQTGKVVIRTSRGTSLRELQQFAQSKSDWIANTLAHAEVKRAKPATPLTYLGRPLHIQIEKSALLRKGGFCELQGDILYVHVPEKLTSAKQNKAIAQILEAWYRERAAEVLRARADHYAVLLGIQYQSIKLADPKSRWGSCDRDGKMMFSWRIVMAPLALLDYLVVHELCHIIHFDHSPAYWRTVGRVMPDYQTRRKALRDTEADHKTGQLYQRIQASLA